MFKGKAIILLGPRQVGKTTLLNQLIEKMQTKVLFVNCDDPETRSTLFDANIRELELLIGDNKVLMIDEAQRVKNIGLTLKLITDNFKTVQLIVTGSSALEIGNEVNEPLTGRKYEYFLYPISSKELIEDRGFLAEKQFLESRMIYGSYPDIINNNQEAKELLMGITNSYLYKDILSMEDIRKPAVLEKLLVALALQIGSEISYHEIGQTINSDSKTVERYIDLLEKSFVIFRLHALSRNVRNELKKSKKVYFYDNGIRNAIIQNFSPLSLRTDVGALWENYFISERVKSNHYNRNFAKLYFWRTSQQQEIDLIEESDGKFISFEMKWNEKRNAKIPAIFENSYNVVEKHIVTPRNYYELL